jgi:hypothetical protein
MTNPQFQPAQNQRRWVRDRQAFIRAQGGQWFHFNRVDVRHERMVDAPYDQDDVGRWESCVESYWRSDALGISFHRLQDAVAWVDELALSTRLAQLSR